MEPVSYAAVEEDCTSGLVMEVFDDLDKGGADVVLLHGCPQSCMPNPVKGLLEVYEDMVEDLDKIVQKNTENSKGSRSKYKKHKRFNRIFQSNRIICETYLEHQQGLHHAFIDFKKAFDRVWLAALWATFKNFSISANLIRVIKHLNDKATTVVLFKGSMRRDWFGATVGAHQGCLFSEDDFGKDHDRRVRRSRRQCQHFRQNNHQSVLC